MKMTNKTATRVGNPITMTGTRRFILTNEIVRYDGDTGVAGGRRDRYNLVTKGGYMAGGFSLAERRVLSSQGWPLAVGEKITKERARRLHQDPTYRLATLTGGQMAKAIKQGAIGDNLEAILHQARTAGIFPSSSVSGTPGGPVVPDPTPAPADATIPTVTELMAAGLKAAATHGHTIGAWTDYDGTWAATGCSVCSAALVVGTSKGAVQIWGAAAKADCAEFRTKMGFATDGEPDAGLGTPAPAPVTEPEIVATEDTVDYDAALVSAIAEAVAQAIASRGVLA